MANKHSKSDTEPAPDQGFLKTLIASSIGAMIAFAAFHWIGPGAGSSDVQQEMLAELRNISAALRAGAPPSTTPAAPPAELKLPERPKDLRLTITDAAVLGRAEAKLVMVEFSDFDCPFCARYSANTKDQLINEYVDTGKMRYAFRHMPLKNLHPNAPREAEAAECARRQGRFWDIYPRLFANQRPASDGEIRDVALAAGVNAAQFDTCFAGQATARVQGDLEDGARAGIIGTPMFFFGRLDESGRVKVEAEVVGAEPIAKFRAVIDPLISP